MRGRGRPSGGGRGYDRNPMGPPDSIIEVGSIRTEVEKQLLCQCTSDRVPYFNGRIYLKDKKHIGQVDEILGPINQYMFSVKLLDGVNSSAFAAGLKLFIDPNQLLPMSRFLPQKPVPKRPGSSVGGRGRGMIGGRGRGMAGGRGRGGFGSRPSFGRGGGGGRGRGRF